MTINELMKELEKLAAKYGENTPCTGEVVVSPKNITFTLNNGTEVVHPIPNKRIVMY
jgi:vacuolar-type H+-ATPase subunit E/Vma4